MKYHYLLTALFSGCLLLLAGCPAPPPATITLPSGVTCAGAVTTNVTAAINPEPGTLRPKLTIKVCVLCNGTPLAGVGGITVSFISEVPLPATVPSTPVTLQPTGTGGCVTKSYIIPGSVLRGEKVKVTVVDSTGAAVTTTTVTIQ